MHLIVILSFVISICVYCTTDINYENLIIYVSTLSWSLTIIQGCYYKFWKFISFHIVGGIIESIMKYRLENLELPGKKDRDGYVITTRDVERLEKILAENEKMLFSKRAGDEKSNDSENTQQAKASDRYTKYVLVVSCLVVLELLTGLADWVGMFNLYVFIPPLFLLYEIQRNIKQITTGHPDEARNKEEYAMALWELYKGKLGV